MKKNYLNSLLVLLVATLLFTGCKKDDEKPASNVTYDGTAYTISEGYYYSETNNDLFVVKLKLESLASSLADLMNYSSIDFTLVSSTEELVPGEYSFNDSYDAPVLTWRNGYFQSTSDDSLVDLVEGTLKIDKSGSTYTVTFTGKTDDDKDITMTYTGAIPEETFE